MTNWEPLPHKDSGKNDPEEPNPRFLRAGVLATVQDIEQLYLRHQLGVTCKCRVYQEASHYSWKMNEVPR